MDPGVGVLGCPGWGGGGGVPMHIKGQEDEGEPERSRDRAIKIPMIGVC